MQCGIRKAGDGNSGQWLRFEQCPAFLAQRRRGRGVPRKGWCPISAFIGSLLIVSAARASLVSRASVGLSSMRRISIGTRVGQVGGHGQRARGSVAGQRGGLLQGVGTPPGEHDAVAGRQQGEGAGAADAATGAGDEGDFVHGVARGGWSGSWIMPAQNARAHRPGRAAHVRNGPGRAPSAARRRAAGARPTDVKSRSAARQRAASPASGAVRRR